MAYGPHGKQADSWWGAATPTAHVSLGALSYVGVTLQFAVPGRIAGYRVYMSSGTSGAFWGILWDVTSGHVVRVWNFRKDVTIPSNAWYQTWFRPWVRIDTTHGYRLAVLQGNGYQRTASALGSGLAHGNITMLNSFQSTSIDPSSVSLTTNTNANGIDVLFQAD